MDQKTLGKLVAFLCSVPPESHLRLLLQLALAVSIPDDKYEELLLPMIQNEIFINLLQEENLLKNLLEADGNLDEAEKNMLLEAMEQIGLFVPMKMQVIDVLTQELSTNLVQEIQEIQDSGAVRGKPLLW